MMQTATAWLRDMTLVKIVIIIYCLNVVAWGGMIFLLLCNAAPAMCHPTCNDINSPRRIWIEIDSQILNALFCVMAFGLAPQRARDAWRLVQHHFAHDSLALRRLAASYRSWFRLPGSQELPSDLGPDEVDDWLSKGGALAVVPHPARSIPDAPYSGLRASPTALWKLATVIGLNVMNTVFQAVLSGFMWGYNRHTRPQWAVPLFLCSAFGVSIAAGVMGGLEGKRVKKVEQVVAAPESS
ncbi:hypothetical protein HYQ45_014661 [Verticillium longisporum]|uniref:Uncharacterized protein n=1 Tax=Verticillium longisporum TaxID=100787 RepID=A0A8I2ZA23_VERLO|nr:hypothetical protein HYQ45_014661 [Verticillium longisporum]